MTIAFVWTAVALIGLFCSGVNFIEAYGDFKAVKAAGANGGRRILARAGSIGETIRVFVQLLFVLIGIIAIRPTTLSPRLAADFFQAALVGAAGLLAIQSMYAIRVRRHLRRYFEGHTHEASEDG